MKKKITFLILVLWMVVIFLFSAQNGTQSSGISRFVGYGIAENKNKLLQEEKSEEKIEMQVEAMQLAIRKGAHMAEYALLAIFFLLHVCSYGGKTQKLWMGSWIFCILYAVTDEIHQVFVPGRDGRIRDVCIDSIGSFLGILLFMLCYKKIQKRRKQKYVESQDESL